MAEENSRKRLGKGLAALMGELDKPLLAEDGQKPQSMHDSVSAEKMVPIEKIRANPNNPRRFFSDAELEELTVSIGRHGIVQPILVRPVADGDLGGATYEIIAGERRWRAAQKARLHDVPIIVREMEDKQALEIAIIENVQRADLNAVEEALGYQQLIDEYDYSQNDLAQVIGKSRSHVANTLRLLKLPKAVQALVSDGQLSAGHARTLVTASDPEKLARQIIADGLSVRQAEALAANDDATNGSSNSKSNATSEKTADIKALEKKLEDKLGLKFDLRHGDGDKGELRIKYKSLEQLDEICRKLESDF